MCKKSESISNLAVALVKAQSEITSVSKDGNNPHFRSKYATLDNIIDETRPILAKHGLAVLQMPGGDGENVIMKTMLMHESGEWLETEPLIMRPVKNDPQGMGSCITYARRYSLSALLSISTDEDDDGNGASRPPQATQSAQRTQPVQTPPRTTQANTGQSRTASNAPHSYKRDAYQLREQLFMGWDDLQNLAERVLNRKLTKVTTIQDEKEWELIVNEMKSYNMGA